jgi:hypothetical protein
VRAVTRLPHGSDQRTDTPVFLVVQAGPSDDASSAFRGYCRLGATRTSSSQGTVPGSLRTSSRAHDLPGSRHSSQVSSQLSDGPLGIRRVAFAVDDIDAAVAGLQARGGELLVGWSATKTGTGSAMAAARRGSSSCLPSSLAEGPGANRLAIAWSATGLCGSRASPLATMRPSARQGVCAPTHASMAAGHRTGECLLR